MYNLNLVPIGRSKWVANGYFFGHIVPDRLYRLLSLNLKFQWKCQQPVYYFILKCPTLIHSLSEGDVALRKKVIFFMVIITAVHCFLYFPSVERPSLGCRELVLRNLGKLVPAISHDMTDWLVATRVRTSQLLSVLLLHSEEYSTQHLQPLLATLYRACTDAEKNVITNVSTYCVRSWCFHAVSISTLSSGFDIYIFEKLIIFVSPCVSLPFFLLSSP